MRSGEVHFIVQYGSNYIAEVEDDNYRLDSAMLYNDIPAGMVNGSFTGPVWWFAGESVTVMDGERDLGNAKSMWTVPLSRLVARISRQTRLLLERGSVSKWSLSSRISSR